ncbi:hypothetical protein HYQ46_008289 [Verticillium longisporum]|nr:hypothetical protein HYQ46_008289 [Verticillium longisporum]
MANRSAAFGGDCAHASAYRRRILGLYISHMVWPLRTTPCSGIFDAKAGFVQGGLWFRDCHAWSATTLTKSRFSHPDHREAPFSAKH